MLFSRIISFFAFAATLGSLVVATPFAEKRDIASVQQAVTNLKSTTDTIVPELKSLVANKKATDATVGPLIKELITAINNAHNSALSSAPALVKHQGKGNATVVAADIASIITTVSELLGYLSPELSTIPILGSLLPELDIALTTLFTSLALVVAGLVTTVVALLGTVTGLLGGLGLGYLGGLLGLLAGI